jgi:DDE family transposase
VLVVQKLSRQSAKIEIDFTDEALTSLGGSVFLSAMADRLELRRRLSEQIRLKQRRRGSSEADMLLSAVYSLAAGDGALCDVDRLRADEPRLEALGLESVPDSRRLGEYLTRFDENAVSDLQVVIRACGMQVAPAVIAHEVATRGYVPIFVDGSAIEVDGRYVEGARVGYNGAPQLWLHSVFIGKLWASQRLLPGGGDVTEGWQEQLAWDVRPLIPEGTPTWVRMDNAYYNGEVVQYCRRQAWDFSVSVTSDTYKKPLRRKVEELLSIDWQYITDDRTEEAAIVRHRPDGWKQEEAYVVVRSHFDGDQRRLTPRYTFILVSRDDLSLRELVARHRGKQGHENAQKGPLIDLDLHHPPCQKLGANQAFYACGQLAQLLLIATQYELLPPTARSHGLRTLIRDLIRNAARLVRTGRRRILRFAKNGLRLDWLSYAANRLDALT